MKRVKNILLSYTMIYASGPFENLNGNGTFKDHSKTGPKYVWKWNDSGILMCRL
jgi:hypothetical protein